MAHLPPAQRAHAEGPHLRAHRRAGGGGHHVAAGDARRRAQLGLPLHLDPRLHLRALGPLHARLRLGGQRLLLLHRRRGRARTRSCRSCTASTASASSRSAPSTTCTGYDGARPVRIGNGAYNQHQHDVWGAVLDSVYLHTKSRDHLDERIWPILKRRSRRALANWREPDRGIWEVRGEPKHFTSSKVMCWVAADRGARLARMRDETELAERVAGGGRRDPRRHLRQRRRRARRVHPALRHRRARRLAAADAAGALPAARRRARAGHRAGHRRRADRRRPGAALPVEETDDGLVGRGGHVHDLLVLAGVGAGRDRRARPGPRAVREAALATPARSASTPRRSTRAAAATSATSRRPSPTWPSSTP